MSLLELNHVIDDAAQDSDLVVLLMEWPHEVLEQYALSDDELDALRKCDTDLLKEFGVDDHHLEKARELFVYCC